MDRCIPVINVGSRQNILKQNEECFLPDTLESRAIHVSREGAGERGERDGRQTGIRHGRYKEVLGKGMQMETTRRETVCERKTKDTQAGDSQTGNKRN